MTDEEATLHPLIACPSSLIFSTFLGRSFSACVRVINLTPENQPTGQQKRERRVDRQVAFPQSTRLLREAVEPFQPAALHPARRHFLTARVEVERRPHAGHYRLDLVLVLAGEHVL